MSARARPFAWPGRGVVSVTGSAAHWADAASPGHVSPPPLSARHHQPRGVHCDTSKLSAFCPCTAAHSNRQQPTTRAEIPRSLWFLSVPVCCCPGLRVTENHGVDGSIPSLATFLCREFRTLAARNFSSHRLGTLVPVVVPVGNHKWGTFRGSRQNPTYWS